MTHRWNFLPISPHLAETSLQLSKDLGLSPILGRLLVERGITTVAQAKKFFRPQLSDLLDQTLERRFQAVGHCGVCPNGSGCKQRG